MKTVVIAFAFNLENDLSIINKHMIGVADSHEGAVKLVKQSGLGFHLTDNELETLRSQSHTTNPSSINFKLETWQVH